MLDHVRDDSSKHLRLACARRTLDESESRAESLTNRKSLARIVLFHPDAVHERHLFADETLGLTRPELFLDNLPID